MDPLEFRVLIDPTFTAPVDNAVSFEAGPIVSLSLPTYEHHGPEYGTQSPGALTQFYEDLILGRPMPLNFAVRRVADIDTVMAAALFLKRDLAILPGTPGMVMGVDLVHRFGFGLLGHLEGDLGRFLILLRAYLPKVSSGKHATAERLVQMVEWVHAYLVRGELPHLGSDWPPVWVIDRGTNGFVLAETAGKLDRGWIELYRMGFLWGLLVQPPTDRRRKVMVSVKSAYVAKDLTKVASILNDLERAQDEPPEWYVEGLNLHGPTEGTLILVKHLLGTLTRL